MPRGNHIRRRHWPGERAIRRHAHDQPAYLTNFVLRTPMHSPCVWDSIRA